MSQAGYWLTFLFVGACAAADVALLVAVSPDRGWPHAAAIALTGLAIGQTGLTAMWLVIGLGSFLERIFGAFAVFCLMTVLLGTATPNSTSEWATVLTPFVLLVVAPLVVSQERGVRWRHSAEQASSTRSAQKRQYSLATLLGATTAIALSLAVARQMDFSLAGMASVSVFVAGFSAVALTSIWAGWGSARQALRLTAALLAAAAIGAAMSLLGRPSDAVPFAATCMIESACIYGGIWTLRTGGYQMDAGQRSK